MRQSLCLKAGEVWSAECWEFWRQPIAKEDVHLGSSSGRAAAGLAKTPAHLQVATADHQSPWRCQGTHLLKFLMDGYSDQADQADSSQMAERVREGQKPCLRSHGISDGKKSSAVQSALLLT